MTKLVSCLLTLTALSVALVACSRTTGPPSTDRVTGTIVSDGANVMPEDSLRSWRDFADQVSVVRVTAEHRLTPNPDDVATGEYVIGRTLDLVADETVWARTTPALTKFTIGDGAWFYSTDPDKGLRELHAEGGTWMLVGHTYLIPVLREPSVTGLMSSSSPQEVIDGKVNAGSITDIVGDTPAMVKAALLSLAPDPAVEKWAAYPPGMRNRLVSEAKEGPVSEATNELGSDHRASLRLTRS
jgi:hypothetical protein